MIGENRYSVSRNYQRLKEHLDKGLMVVCFVDCRVDGFLMRDVCMAEYDKRIDDDFSKYVFHARGIEYCAWNPRQAEKYKDYPDFAWMMAAHNVEFIDFD